MEGDRVEYGVAAHQHIVKELKHLQEEFHPLSPVAAELHQRPHRPKECAGVSEEAGVIEEILSLTCPAEEMAVIGELCNLTSQ